MGTIRCASAVFFAFCGVALSAQSVDWAQTPVNPLPVKYKAEHFNLKGPVYAAGKQVFDERGYLLKETVEYLYDEKGQPTGKGSVTWQSDADGRIVREVYAGGRTTDFTYTDGRLTGAKYHYLRHKGGKSFRIEGTQIYGYDSQGRLIRETLEETDEENGNKSEATTYVYAQEGDGLKVVKTVQKGDQSPVRTHDTYKDGWHTHSRTEGEPIELTIEYTFDAYGNPTTFAHVQNNGVRDTFSRSFSYYPELKKENRISFGSENRKTFYPITVFRNGKPADDIVYNLTADKKSVLIYDDFSNSYYAAPFDENRKPEDEVPAQLFVADTDVFALFNPEGKKTEPFYKGSRLFVGAKGKVLQMLTGEILCFAASNLSTEATTILLEKPEDGGQTAGIAQVLRGRVLKHSYGRFDSHLFYVALESGGIQLVNDGENVSGKGTKTEAMSEGDLLMLDEAGEPKYVLPGGQVNPRPGVYAARYYVPSEDAQRRKGDAFDGVPGFSETEIAALLAPPSEEVLRSQVPRKVDRVNAPLNWKEHLHVRHRDDIGMKGSVVYVNQNYTGYYFDEDGWRIYPRKDYFTNEADARKHRGRYLCFDSGGKLVRQQSFASDDDWTKVYQYNPDGTLRSTYLIEDGQIGRVDDFTYDERGRVTKHVERARRATETRTYSYSEKDGKLTVVEQVTPVGPHTISKTVSVYEDGEVIERTVTLAGVGTKSTFTIEYDEVGNVVRKTDHVGSAHQPYYYYESELYGSDFPQTWQWKRNGSSLLLFVDGREVDIITRTGKSPHGVFYEPISQHYLVARNAYAPEGETDNPDASGPMEALARGPFLFHLLPDGSGSYYRYGSAIGEVKPFFNTGNEMLVYEPGKNRTYLMHGFEGKLEDRFFPLQDLWQDAVIWWQRDKESNVVLLQNGEQLDGKGLSFGGKYPSGSTLLLKDGEPWMILTMMQRTSYDKVHVLAPYAGQGKPGETPQKVEMAPYKPRGSLTIRNFHGAHQYLQMGKPTYAPSIFYINRLGVAVAAYPPDRYHFFDGMGSAEFKQGDLREETRGYIGQHLAEVDGETVRVWYDRQRLPEDSYTVFDYPDRSRRKLLCIPSKKEYALLDPQNGFREFRFLTPLGGPNFLIKNTDGSLRLIERGTELTGEDIGLWISGKGHTIISVAGDPTYALPDRNEELTPGIYSLSDFSYSYVNTD